MVKAQTMMQTDKLIALMFMAAIIGFVLDRALLQINRSLAKWRFAQ